MYSVTLQSAHCHTSIFTVSRLSLHSVTPQSLQCHTSVCTVSHLSLYIVTPQSLQYYTSVCTVVYLRTYVNLYNPITRSVQWNSVCEVLCLSLQTPAIPSHMLVSISCCFSQLSLQPSGLVFSHSYTCRDANGNAVSGGNKMKEAVPVCDMPCIVFRDVVRFRKP